MGAIDSFFAWIDELLGTKKVNPTSPTTPSQPTTPTDIAPVGTLEPLQPPIVVAPAEPTPATPAPVATIEPLKPLEPIPTQPTDTAISPVPTSSSSELQPISTTDPVTPTQPSQPTQSGNTYTLSGGVLTYNNPSQPSNGQTVFMGSYRTNKGNTYNIFESGHGSFVTFWSDKNGGSGEFKEWAQLVAYIDSHDPYPSGGTGVHY